MGDETLPKHQKPMKFRSTLVLAIVLTMGFSLADTAQVFFSPNGGCTKAAVQQIDRAQKDIVFEAYSFTSPEILAAFQRAIKRGVAVRALYDRSQKNDAGSLSDELSRLGPKRVYATQKIMHNKVIVIDRKVVITGSFNFTVNAERFNAENMVILSSPSIAKKYLSNFDRLSAMAGK